jgi:hypothetical protein
MVIVDVGLLVLKLLCGIFFHCEVDVGLMVTIFCCLDKDILWLTAVRLLPREICSRNSSPTAPPFFTAEHIFWIARRVLNYGTCDFWNSKLASSVKIAFKILNSVARDKNRF